MFLLDAGAYDLGCYGGPNAALMKLNTSQVKLVGVVPAYGRAEFGLDFFCTVYTSTLFHIA